MTTKMQYLDMVQKQYHKTTTTCPETTSLWQRKKRGPESGNCLSEKKFLPKIPNL